MSNEYRRNTGAHTLPGNTPNPDTCPPRPLLSKVEKYTGGVLSEKNSGVDLWPVARERGNIWSPHKNGTSAKETAVANMLQKHDDESKKKIQKVDASKNARASELQ